MESSSPSPSPGPALGLDARLGVDTRLWAKVLFAALCSLILALGAAGSALSVRVVLKGRAGPPGRLRYHVFSLALSALPLWPVGVPVELFNFVSFHYPWVFGDPGGGAYYFVREPCAYATVLSVGGPSAKRCLTVRQPAAVAAPHPPSAVALLGRHALPMAVITRQKHELEKAGGEPEPASRVCTVLVSRATLQVCIQVNVLVSFVLPLALTAFLNGVSVSHLVALGSQVPSLSAPGSPVPQPRGANERGEEEAPPGGPHQPGAIVAVYVTCWMPSHTRRLMYRYVSNDGWTGTLYDYLVTDTLFYVSSAVTPVLNNAVSSSFRKLFLEALGSLCREGHPRGTLPPPGSPGAPRLQALGIPQTPRAGCKRRTGKADRD